MSEFRVGQKVYCIEPCEGLEFGKAYTIIDMSGPFVTTDEHKSGFVRRFSAIDPLVQGPDSTPLDASFWERAGGSIVRDVGDGVRVLFSSSIDGRVVMSRSVASVTWYMLVDKVTTLGQLRRLVAAVLGEG